MTDLIDREERCSFCNELFEFSNFGSVCLENSVGICERCVSIAMQGIAVNKYIHSAMRKKIENAARGLFMEFYGTDI